MRSGWASSPSNCWLASSNLVTCTTQQLLSRELAHWIHTAFRQANYKPLSSMSSRAFAESKYSVLWRVVDLMVPSSNDRALVRLTRYDRFESFWNYHFYHRGIAYVVWAHVWKTWDGLGSTPPSPAKDAISNSKLPFYGKEKRLDYVPLAESGLSTGLRNQRHRFKSCRGYQFL